MYVCMYVCMYVHMSVPQYMPWGKCPGGNVYSKREGELSGGNCPTLKTREVDCTWQFMVSLLAAEAIFGPPGICK